MPSIIPPKVVTQRDGNVKAAKQTWVAQNATPYPMVSKSEVYGVSLFNLEGIPLEKWKKWIWGFSSAGRAPALQAGGQRFDPANLHQFKEVD